MKAAAARRWTGQRAESGKRPMAAGNMAEQPSGREHQGGHEAEADEVPMTAVDELHRRRRRRSSGRGGDGAGLIPASLPSLSSLARI